MDRRPRLWEDIFGGCRGTAACSICLAVLVLVGVVVIPTNAGDGDLDSFDAGRLAWRQSCLITYTAGCARSPWLFGLHDDIPDAYGTMHVGVNQSRCLERAREHFEWCQNEWHQRIVATFAPTGAEAEYPEGRGQNSKEVLDASTTAYNAQSPDDCVVEQASQTPNAQGAGGDSDQCGATTSVVLWLQEVTDDDWKHISTWRRKHSWADLTVYTRQTFTSPHHAFLNHMLVETRSHTTAPLCRDAFFLSDLSYLHFVRPANHKLGCFRRVGPFAWSLRALESEVDDDELLEQNLLVEKHALECLGHAVCSVPMSDGSESEVAEALRGARHLKLEAGHVATPAGNFFASARSMSAMLETYFTSAHPPHLWGRTRPLASGPLLFSNPYMLARSWEVLLCARTRTRSRGAGAESDGGSLSITGEGEGGGGSPYSRILARFFGGLLSEETAPRVHRDDFVVASRKLKVFIYDLPPGFHAAKVSLPS